MYADLSTCDSPRCVVMFYYRMAFKLGYVCYVGPNTCDKTTYQHDQFLKSLLLLSTFPHAYCH